MNFYFQSGEFLGQNDSDIWPTLLGGLIGFLASLLIWIATEYRNDYKNRKIKLEEEDEKENYLTQILKFLFVNLNTQESYLILDKEELSKHSFDINLKSSNFDVKIDLLKTITYNDLLRIHKKYEKKLKVFNEFLSDIFTVENIVFKYPEKVRNFNIVRDELKREYTTLKIDFEFILNNKMYSIYERGFYDEYIENTRLYNNHLEGLQNENKEIDEITIYHRMVIIPLLELKNLREFMKRDDINNILYKCNYIINQYDRMISDYQKEFTNYILIFTEARMEFKKLIDSLERITQR